MQSKDTSSNILSDRAVKCRSLSPIKSGQYSKICSLVINSYGMGTCGSSLPSVKTIEPYMSDQCAVVREQSMKYMNIPYPPSPSPPERIATLVMIGSGYSSSTAFARWHVIGQAL